MTIKCKPAPTRLPPVRCSDLVMPTTLNIPARHERHCEPCEHLKRENMLCSRLNGISCDYVCHHPEAHEWGKTPTDPKKAELMGQLRARLTESGRMIGRSDRQPQWCPMRLDDAA